MFHNIVRDKVTNKTVSTDHILRRERRAEADSNRGPSAYHPNALQVGQTGSHVIPLKHFAFTTRLGVSSPLVTRRSSEGQFQMVYLCARKSPHALHPISQKIPKVAFQTISMFVICHIQFTELARVVCVSVSHRVIHTAQKRRVYFFQLYKLLINAALDLTRKVLRKP